MIQVTAAIISRNNKVLLARREPGKHLEGYWEFPGGKIEEGEEPEECLAREIKEELGINILVGKHYLDSPYSYDHITILLKSYLCKLQSGDFELTDHDRIEWVDVEQLHTYKLAPADIPIIKKLQSKYEN